MREVEARVGGLGAKLRLNGVNCLLVIKIFVDSIKVSDIRMVVME